MFRRGIAWLRWLLTIIPGPCLAFAGPLPGRLEARVQCRNDPGQSYALYLPSSYDPARRWPLVLALDPGARGSVPVEHFRQGAERYGYILAGSNNSRNGPVAVAMKAVEAVWRDVTSRFSVEPKVLYLVGFSGGARMASQMGMAIRPVRGVIGCGAGFIEIGRHPQLRYAHLGVAGVWDMNYLELKSLDLDLKSQGSPSGFLTFQGGHQWPPEKICSRALLWMHLEGMREGWLQRDEALVSEAYREQLQEARLLEKQGKEYPAYLAYSFVEEEFEHLQDTREARAGSSALFRRSAVQKAISRVAEVESREAERVREISRAVHDHKNPRPLTWWEKEVERIRAMDDGDPYLADSRKRLLGLVRGFGAERSWFARQQGETKRAVYLARIALLVEPGHPWLLLNLARSLALDGQPGKAVAALKRALEAGLSEPGRILSDPELKNLRGREDFRAIRERLARPPGGG